MARVFITGSADGLGRLAAQTLLEDGHEVVVHARNRDRLTAVRDLVDRGAMAVVGDLSDVEQTRGIARDVNRLGPMDAVIHNAGVYTGPDVMPVNIVAPYLLTALIDRPQRLVYLSSGAHRSGRASINGVDWSGRTTGSYSDSKLFVTTLAVTIAGGGPMSSATPSTQDGCPRGWAGAAHPMISGSDTSRRSGWPPATRRTRAPPAATGTTNSGSNRIPPSTISGSRVSCWTNSRASPARASPDAKETC